MPILQQDAVGRRWSVEDVWAIPDDGNRYETVDGELLVSPSPRILHQAVVGEVFAALRAWVRAQGIGVALFAPSDVVLDPFTLVQPDVFVLPRVGRDVMLGKVAAPNPLFVIEVLSPSTARNDRLRKRARYLRAGITCWLVDPESLIVECWMPGEDRPVVCDERAEWMPSPGAVPFVLDLKVLWAELGE